MTGPFGDQAIHLVLDRAASTPQRDMGLSQELLAGLARPEVEGRLRVYRPRPTAAFSRLDTLAAGYPDAERASRSHGFEPVVRPVGGRLAAYHGHALVLDLVARHPAPREQFRSRFALFSEVFVTALRRLGVPAQIGPVAGEYCPGDFSVNAAGQRKLVGTAQRLTRHGYLLSAALLVDDPGPVRAVLSDAYALLGLQWRPDTVGCVADHVPGIAVAEVVHALLPELRRVLPFRDDTVPALHGRPRVDRHTPRPTWSPAGSSRMTTPRGSGRYWTASRQCHDGS